MSAAILFYGYNLGAPDDGGWAITNGAEFEPDWIIEAEEDFEGDGDGEGYEFYMRRAILLADGIPATEITSDNASDLLKRLCSMEVISFGHANTLFLGLALAGSLHRADDWSPRDIGANSNLCNPAVVDFADDGYLYNALRTLDMLPIQERASWILAPDE